MPDPFVVAPGARISVGVFNGDSFPESEVSPVLERLRDVRLISAAGSVDVDGLRVVGKEIRGETHFAGPSGAVATARTIPHFISLQPKQFKSYLAGEGLDAVISWREKHQEEHVPSRERYSKYAKALIAVSSSAGRSGAGGSAGDNSVHSRPTGMTLEIVPDASPYDLRAGDPLPIRVLYRGKPAAGLQIQAAWAGAGVARQISIAGRTDANGALTVRLGRPGKWRLHTVLMERCADPKAADWESYWASLTFETR